MTAASSADVERALLRHLEEDELQWVQSMLDYVEATVRLRLPTAVDRAATDAAYSLVLSHVEAEAVARVLRAPGGGLYKYETEGTYTYSVNQAVASGLLEVTEKEWALLSTPLGTTGYGSMTPVMGEYAPSARGDGDMLGVRPLHVEGESPWWV